MRYDLRLALFFIFFTGALIYKATAATGAGLLAQQSHQVSGNSTLLPFTLEPIATKVGQVGNIDVLNLQTGNIVNTCTVFNDNDHSKSYLIIHRLTYFPPGKPFKRSDAVNTQVYEVKKHNPMGSFTLYGAQFSPNGKYILLKYGDSYSFNGSHYLYVFDTTDKRLYLASPDELANELQYWSPDSNYVAYIEGGDASGNPYLQYGPTEVESPLSLRICNWRTGKVYIVKKANSVNGAFHWFDKHTLLYSYLNDPSSAHNGNAKKLNEPTNSSSLTIEQYVIEENKSKPLNITGYHPVPSIDGKSLVFWGSEDTSKPVSLQRNWEIYPGTLSMCVASIDGSKRKALNLGKGAYPFIYWLPDNQHFLTFQQWQKPDGHVGAEIKSWDIKTGKFREVTTIKASDYKYLPRAIGSRNFNPIELMNNGNRLIVAVDEAVERDAKQNIIRTKKTIVSVNVENGEVTPIAQMRDVGSADWTPSS